MSGAASSNRRSTSDSKRASDRESSKHRSSSKSPGSGEHPSSSSSPSSKLPSASDARRRAADTAKTVGDGAGKAYDTVADCFGGEKELDKTIRQFNPTFYDFAEKSFMKNTTITNKPGKFLLFLIALGIIQSFIPLFQWPLDFVARYLGFIFMYRSGLDELKEGFESSRRAPKVKSLLTVFMLSSAIQLIPNFLFNTYYHFGALWSFFLPVILFITPWKDAPEQTLATLICDTFFSSGAAVLGSLIPASMQGENGQNLAILVGAVVGLLFWVGYLGGTAAYVAVWFFLAFSTIDNLGRTFISKEESSTGFYAQMTIWHNLLAIWLWRFLISAIEGISVPGLISVIGLILHYIPSYFLWMTGFMFAMLMTKKTEKRHRADTWYARWLTGVIPSPTSSSSSSSTKSSSHSGSNRGSSSNRESSSRQSSQQRPRRSRAQE
ncbi:hypothetical protein IAR55_004047 [Kwoniella newhampshirensis]|uniref:Uncharacterized protein n=1 Tax=Kwoniella newhampshirensis TaxID=1651941 RepID=A0AAW0YPX2_9TREE